MLIRLPIRLFRVPASRRDDAGLRSLLASASELWTQASIRLELVGDVVLLPFDPARTTTQLLATDDGGSIAGCAVPDLGGSNGVSNSGTKRFLIADITTVPSERVLAHELGHILIGIGPDHPLDSERLMATGEVGIHLTEDEIEKARDRAIAFADLR